MRSYITLFKTKFMASLQYRTAAIAGILTQVFFGLIFVMVYIAFFKSNTKAPLELSKLISYLWLNQAFFSLTYLMYFDNDINNMIRKGDVAYELVRPQSIYFKWFFRIYATKIAQVLLRFVPVILFSLLLPKPYNLLLPNDFYSFIGFLLTLFLASILIVTIVMIIHLLVFYLIDSMGLMSMIRVISEFFTGSLVPMALMPRIVQKISNYLPFQYTSDVPFRIYSGLIPSSNILSIIIIQTIWILVLLIVGYIMSNRILKKVSVQGG